MGIVDEDIERVKAAADLVQLVSEVAGVKKVGRQWQALCPFHAEKTPSFYVNAELGFYHCYGCGAGGDVISFVRNVHHLDFVQAVEWLAARSGITLRYDDEKTGRDQARRGVLLDAMEQAVEWYHRRLLTADDAGRARAYLRSRGYDRTIVEQFRLGWAPDDWDAMSRALKLPHDVLQETGLAFVNRAGNAQDSFRARVLFPIFDPAGRPVAFGGRVLPGGDGPKYKNSADSKLYAKSRVLYGLNWAKEDAARSDEVVVCEGYTDVIAFFQAGVPRAVATCGTAVTEDHIRTLRNFAPRLVLAFDADAAGQTAAHRFYEWEQKYEIDVAVAALPPGTDPGDLGRQDPEALRQAVKDARPFLEFRLDRVLARANLRTAEGRARAAEDALAVVGEHPSELVRDQYLMRVADMTRLDPARLRSHLALPAARRRPLVETAAAPRSRSAAGPEVEALRLAVHRPALVADRLEQVLFEDEMHSAAFSALASANTLAEAIEQSPPEVAALLQRLAVEDVDVDADDVVARLVDRAVARALTRLQARARQSERPEGYGETIGWLKVTSAGLVEPASSVDASRQLVAWLVRFSQEEE